MTPQERKVLELALQFIESNADSDSERELVATIKEALAQPERDYERGFIDGMQKQMQSSVDKAVNRLAQLDQDEVDIRSLLYQRIHELETQLAQPEQEPVKLVSYNCKCGRTMNFESVHGVVAPQRKPLTRAQIINAVATAFNFNSRDYDEIIEPVARAIEAAHGIKE